MATRRNVPQTSASNSSTLNEKTISESQGGPPSSMIKSDTRPAVPSDVIVKLLLFTFAMVVVPIGSYFVTLNLVFRGGFAAIMANVVLVGYIIVAVREDQGDQQAATPGVNSMPTKAEGKKSQ